LVILTGDSRGSLSPCGCSKPMVGGLSRLASVVRSYDAKGSAVLLANASLTGGIGRQEELKAQTMAQALKSLGASAIHLTEEEAQAPEIRLAFENTLGSRVLTDERPEIVVGGVRVAIAPGASLDNEEAAARAHGQKLVVLLDGGQSEARQIAMDHPSVALVDYRQDGRADWSRVGSTLLATPGSKLQYVMMIEVVDGGFGEPESVVLDERVKDDSATDRLYRTYLGRVDHEDLLAQTPRSGRARFAGSKRCGDCHADAYRIWSQSRHAGALRTLEAQGHGRDPECVSCHVVGLDSVHGFQSERLTPQLAAVGCESCHGPGLAHAEAPRRRSLPSVGARACMACHVSDHSPDFNFATFWPRVKH
jgi:hypothetical protein